MNTPGDAASTGDLPALPATQAGRYRHYKGGEYEVLGTVRHSETTEPLVLYRALYGEGGLWVRPHAMFFENVCVEGRWQARFAPLKPASEGSAAADEPGLRASEA